jgi:hypothetical protein
MTSKVIKSRLRLLQQAGLSMQKCLVEVTMVVFP